MTPNRTPIVLIVDDEPAIREVARRILESNQYTVIEASDGVEAVALLATDAPIDLLMADLEMPTLTGEETARRCRQARPDLKILYVSGVVDRLLDARPTLWEGEAFLDKPFTAAGLLQAVGLLVHGSTNGPRQSS
jgi:CheY-like chemotaxis protein